MKTYNKPVVEISSFDVEDIITISTYFGGEASQSELQGVYSNFAAGAGESTTTDDVAEVFEW